MSFDKAQQLLRLATMAASRHLGITLDDVTAEFGVSKRTAQRMLHTLEVQFHDTETSQDYEGRKRWRMPSASLSDLVTLTPDDLAALDLAIESFAKSSQEVEAGVLVSLRDKIRALVPRNKAARLETDHEALLEAQGLAARPGPVAQLSPDVNAAISRALKGSERLRITYKSRGRDVASERVVDPYGILLGIRRYLVARPKDDPDGPMRHYIAENIERAELTGEIFERDPEFRIDQHARKAFGAYQDSSEYGEVIWRFSPEVADHARRFRFHPDQSAEDGTDGSLIVRFQASGHLEMCWHLYTWGDKVEVIAPESLRAATAGYRRSDFTALP